MARYRWDSDSVLRSLRKIDKLMSKETDEVELARLHRYYDEINSVLYGAFYYPDVTTPLYQRMPRKLDSFLSNQRYYDFLFPYNDALIANEGLIDEVQTAQDKISDQIAQATGAHVTKEQAIGICYDFYKNLDEELFEHFKRFHDMRFNHMRFIKPKDAEKLDYNGCQYYLYGTNESFLNIVGYNKPQMSTTIIHEAAHVIDNSINPDNYLSKDFYYEVITLFMQLVSYYKRAGNFDELYYYNKIVADLSNISYDMNDAYDYSSIMQAYINNKYRISPEFYKSIRGELKMSKKEVDDFLKTYDPKYISYPLSFSMALAFFNIYKQDEKKGLENLKRFIKTKNRDDYIPLVLSDSFSEKVEEEVRTLLTESKECFERHAK